MQTDPEDGDREENQKERQGSDSEEGPATMVRLPSQSIPMGVPLPTAGVTPTTSRKTSALDLNLAPRRDRSPTPQRGRGGGKGRSQSSKSGGTARGGRSSSQGANPRTMLPLDPHQTQLLPPSAKPPFPPPSLWRNAVDEELEQQIPDTEGTPKTHTYANTKPTSLGRLTSYATSSNGP